MSPGEVPSIGDIVTVRHGEDRYRVLNPRDPKGWLVDLPDDVCTPVTLLEPESGEAPDPRPCLVETRDLTVVERVGS